MVYRSINDLVKLRIDKALLMQEEIYEMEKICVCPECHKIVRLIEPSPLVCFRANEILKSNKCSWSEALQLALDEINNMEEEK
jgi:hypothetical protein